MSMLHSYCKYVSSIHEGHSYYSVICFYYFIGDVTYFNGLGDFVSIFVLLGASQHLNIIPLSLHV